MAEPILRVSPDAAALAEAAASRFLLEATAAVEERGRFLVCLSGGATPLGLYRVLAASPYRDAVPWASVEVFWGDERLVPKDDPENSYSQARDALLDPVAVPVANIHRVRSTMSPSAAVADYTARLRAAARATRSAAGWPRFDLVLLGLGRDGHTASLFPGSPVEQTAPVVAVMADYDGRPANRVTLTPPVFDDARRVWFLVTGEGKAEAVASTLQGPDDPARWPAQRIRPLGGELSWWLDPGAARLLS